MDRKEQVSKQDIAEFHALEREDLPRFPVVFVQPPDMMSVETVCGAEDFQDVERYNGTLGVATEFVDAHQAPVGQLQWYDDLASKYTQPGNVSGKRWASGTLISEDLFLTAGHCFDQNPVPWTVPRINGTNNPISSQEIAKNIKVNFNYQVDFSGNPRSPQSFAILELIEYRLGGLDFAIVRLDGNPGQVFGHTKVAKIDAKLNDMVCIIQHPDGRMKQVEAGPVTFLQNDERIGYNSLDTLGGTSGSAILLTLDGTIVGVHTNGGCESSAQGFNYGVRISSLLTVSPTLQSISND
ncbi:trypsin-like peptidase domain-containing protein (plasmid) [Bacillus wiedmannii]|uniref:trypsin-like serine peptidase n=1 Tax=Bacillus wiedmannii TaxID=1890302 RepID=UPI0028834B8C|nr:trypsin-like peptidase domain-containing protein [Bacillus wiedmannii]WMS85339.1 trypsin-like peptidase domain-containing protein [Bacillus wiedmannii]